MSAPRVKVGEGPRPYSIRVNDSHSFSSRSLGSLSEMVKQGCERARREVEDAMAAMSRAEQDWRDFENASTAVEAAIRERIR